MCIRDRSTPARCDVISWTINEEAFGPVNVTRQPEPIRRWKQAILLAHPALESNPNRVFAGTRRIALTIRALMQSAAFAAALVFLLLLASAAAQQTRVVVDGNGTGRVFDGLGAASAGASSRLLIDYPEPQRSQILRCV